jgi:hypothetical protein
MNQATQQFQYIPILSYVHASWVTDSSGMHLRANVNYLLQCKVKAAIALAAVVPFYIIRQLHEAQVNAETFCYIIAERKCLNS